MNIFAFDPDPCTSAIWLDDVRKNKMILETAQLLSAVIKLNEPESDLPVYKLTHKGHPCTIWARSSRGNYGWLLTYMKALWVQRDRPHKSADLIQWFDYYHQHGSFESEGLQPFANCARNKERGLDFTHVPDVHEAYRLYMVERWKENTIKLSWNHGIKPEWSN